MVDSHETGSYEWPSMSLSSSLNCTLTVIHQLRRMACRGGLQGMLRFLFFPLPKAACLLEYPSPLTSGIEAGMTRSQASYMAIT